MFFSLPWYVPKSETIKLNSCRNLIEHYLGNFLGKLTLEQLSVNLYNGTGTISDVTLDCDALNKLGEDRNWPLQIVKGHMQDITIKVPWSNVFKDDSVLKVEGLSLLLQPKMRPEPVKSFLKWVVINWPKLTSKKLFMLNKKTDDLESHTDNGEEMFADSIEAILKRLKLKLENTKIRIEHLPKHINRGFALDIYIRSIDCYDEAISDFIPVGTDFEDSGTYILDTYTKKKIKIEGVTLYTDEFYINRNTTPPRRESLLENRFKVDFVNKNVSDCFLREKITDVQNIEPNTKKNLNLKENSDNIKKKKTNQIGPIMFAILNGPEDLKLSINKSVENEELSFEAETVGPHVLVLSPKQLEAVTGVLNCLKETESTSDL